jgi:hypothetical protein
MQRFTLTTRFLFAITMVKTSRTKQLEVAFEKLNSIVDSCSRRLIHDFFFSKDRIDNEGDWSGVIVRHTSHQLEKVPMNVAFVQIILEDYGLCDGGTASNQQICTFAGNRQLNQMFL